MTDLPTTVRTSRPALHLLWVIPLITLPAFAAFVVGGFDLCGISGCSGGGFGRDVDYQWVSWVCCWIIGVLYFVGFVSVEWVRPRLLRVILSAAIGTLIGTMVALVYRAALPNS